MADYLSRCHLPSVEMTWGGTRQSFLINNANSYFGQRIRRAVFPVECVGETGVIGCMPQNLCPNIPLSLFAVMNILLRIAHSRSGNMFTELSGLDEVTWLHLATLTQDSSISFLRIKLLPTPISTYIPCAF